MPPPCADCKGRAKPSRWDHRITLADGRIASMVRRLRTPSRSTGSKARERSVKKPWMDTAIVLTFNVVAVCGGDRFLLWMTGVMAGLCATQWAAWSAARKPVKEMKP